MENQKNYDSMFNLDDDEDSCLVMIETDRLIGFGDHIFAPYSEVDMLELMKSIELRGLLTPIIIRDHPTETGMFEILAGHNRVNACKRLGIGKIHARIMENISEDESKLIVIETNLMQRNIEDFKLSDRARIITEWHKLIKRQGLRTDLLKENTEDQHSEKDEEKPFHLGKSQICNYVRINDFLFSDLKDLMDLDKLSIKSSVELSYLVEADQLLVRDLINDGIRITDSKAKAIKKLSLDEGLTKESLERLLHQKDNEKKKLLKIPTILLTKYFGNKGEAEIIDILELALSKYFENSEK